MRIAHWSIWAPQQSGMYHTTKDLVLGQRDLGIDCAFIDAQNPDKAKTDGSFGSDTFRFADTADIDVMHLCIPEPYFSDDVPKVVALHGHPLYSMQTELYGLEPANERPFTTILSYMQRTQRTWFVSFWQEEQRGYWDAIAGNYKHHRIRYVPRGIHIGPELSPTGPKRDLEGDPVIVVADQFRLFKDALPCLFGAYAYWQRNPQARVYIYGLPPQGLKARDVIDRWVGNSCLHRSIGSLNGLVDYLPEIFRSADVLVSTVTAESRVVLEAQACGCRVVGPWPQADGRVDRYWEPQYVADAIEAALPKSREETAAGIRSTYDIRPCAEAMKALYEEILSDG